MPEARETGAIAASPTPSVLPALCPPIPGAPASEGARGVRRHGLGPVRRRRSGSRRLPGSHVRVLPRRGRLLRDRGVERWPLGAYRVQGPGPRAPRGCGRLHRVKPQPWERAGGPEAILAWSSCSPAHANSSSSQVQKSRRPGATGAVAGRGLGKDGVPGPESEGRCEGRVEGNGTSRAGPC